MTAPGSEPTLDAAHDPSAPAAREAGAGDGAGEGSGRRGGERLDGVGGVGGGGGASTPSEAGGAIHPLVRAYVDSAAIADTYDRDFATNPLFEYDARFVLRHLRLPMTVLDAGCGTGRHLTLLAAMGFDCVGLDLSAHMLANARANLLASRRAPRLVRGDLHHLPFPERPCFDAVLCMFSTLGLIHPAANRAAVLRGLVRRLRPGGLLLGHVHNRRFHEVYRRTPLEAVRESVRASLAWLSGLGRSDAAPASPGEAAARAWTADVEPGDKLIEKYRDAVDLYLHCFDHEELRALLVEAGLDVIELQPLNLRRDGPYEGRDAPRRGNGFLFAGKVPA